MVRKQRPTLKKKPKRKQLEQAFDREVCVFMDKDQRDVLYTAGAKGENWGRIIGAKLNKKGCKNGVWDHWIGLPKMVLSHYGDDGIPVYRFCPYIGIENKVRYEKGKGRTRANQDEWHRRAALHGALTFICYDIEDFKAIVELYTSLPDPPLYMFNTWDINEQVDDEDCIIID
jgi:hypothetical protein